MSNYQKAETIFTNGNVLTMENNDEYSTIVVKNGLIADLGNSELVKIWQDDNTKVINLEGKTIMPSFIESHVHPVIYAQNMIEIDCRPSAVIKSEDILVKIKAATSEVPEGEWIRGFGWIEQGRIPTLTEIDEVAPNHPVFLKRTCNHIAAVNSMALAKCGINSETADPQGGTIEKDGNGNLTGLLYEQALTLIQLPDYKLADLKKGFKIAQNNFLEWGITTVHEMAATTKDMKLYQTLLEEDQLQVRVRPWLLALDFAGMKGMLDSVLDVGIQSNFGNDYLRIQGVKYLLDGAGSGGTAAVSEPNESDNKNGIINYDFEEYAPYVKQSIEAGLRIAVHAIGDNAIELALNAYEEANKHVDITKMRNRIEHVGLPSEDHLIRMKKLELVAACSVGFLYHVGDNYLYHYGKERMKKLYPQNSFRKHGIKAPANSDLPVVSANPFEGIYGSVTRTTKNGTVLDTEQNISVMDALKSYTTDAAYSSFEEDKIGVIKKDAKADLIVLTDNPLDVETPLLKDISVLQTYIDGQLVWHKE